MPGFRKINVRRPDKSGLSLTGFTLLELLIVIALIMIIAGTVGPRLDTGLKARRLDLESKKLASNIGLAQQYAINQKDTHRFYGVVFYSVGYRIVPYDVDPSAPLTLIPLDPIVVPNSVNVEGDIPFSSEINVSSSQNVIFNFRGETLSSSDAQIVLTNGSSTKTIIISRLIGYVTIQ